MKRRRRPQEQPRRQQQRRQILSEEEYTSTLSSIIQRDYYPHAQQLERQNALLDRRLMGDVAGAVAIRRATRQLIEHEELQAIQRQQEDLDLVAAVDVADSGIMLRSRPRPLRDETLTGFHVRVTNEDDHEFDTTQKQQLQANRQRLEDVFSLEGRKAITGTKQLLEIEDELASDDFNADPNIISAAEWHPPAIRNPLFFNPSPTIQGGGTDGGKEYTTDKGRLLTSGASKGGSAAATRSGSSTTTTTTLMLPPSQPQTQSMLTQRKQRQQQQQPPPSKQNAAAAAAATATGPVAKHELVEYIPKKQALGEKKIDPTQTRFPSKGLVPTRSMHGGIVNHLPYHGETSSDTDDAASMSLTDASSHYGTDLDAPLKSIEEERHNRRQQQKTNNKKQQQQRSYVAMTPLIVPGTGRESSPITTWGTMDGTPLVLSGQETTMTGDSGESKSVGSPSTASAFTLSAETMRERAARDAESKLAQRARRAKQQRPPSFSNHMRRRQQAGSQQDGTAQGVRGGAGSLTPSAMSLLRKASSKAGNDMFASSLRRSYTPKLSSSSLSSRMPSSSRSIKRQVQGSSRLDHAYNATPLMSEQQKK